ncbi:MAG TPA: hypothetical protein VEJ20_02100, partial [Candidatus Eremiobacteraceae bacterium]|nr:hypothetical protein [Candidatus Eremiobacteraceae bacterium]
MNQTSSFTRRRGGISARPAIIVAALVSASGILAAGLSLHPAVANSAETISPDSIVSCDSASACQAYDNTSTGPAFEGETGKGTGLEGAASKAGIGVWGSSMSGLGVFGQSSSYVGIFGVSSSDIGIWGETQTDSDDGLAGVYGISAGTSGHDYGVAGTS